MSPAPLGAPIPQPPDAIFTIQPKLDLDTSFNQHKLIEGWLERLAPQPDGAPPLLQSYVSERCDFKLKYPFGSENVIYGDSFDEDAVESQATVRFDQPLYAMKVTMPGRAPEVDAAGYAHNIITEAVPKGATVIEEPHEVQLPGGRFVRLAYQRQTGDIDLIHYIYVTALPVRVLIFDLMVRPEQRALGEAYVDKIMRSLEPGPHLKHAYEMVAMPKQ